MAIRSGNKRDLIIASAKSIFSNKGYHSATVEEIAALAGIGKGTIYEYFPSKLALFQGMLTEIFVQYFDSWPDFSRDDLTFRQYIQAISLSHLEFCLSNQELTRLLFLEGERIVDQQLKEWGYQLRKEKEGVLADMTAAAIARGELRPVNPELVASIISGLLGSICFPVAMGEYVGDIFALSDQMVDILMYGIANSTV